jgi:phosphoribosylaminoimidazole-succinocarboxamide synthase
MEPKIHGKVREVYDIEDDRLIIVTTDRISAFDVILPLTIKNKGIVLNKISLFWFNYTKSIVENHVLSDNISDMPEFFQKKYYNERTIIVKELKIIPYEFVIRGYMFGNLWNAYQEGKNLFKEKTIRRYELAEKLEKPLLTPAIKNQTGHDEYVDMDSVSLDLGKSTVDRIEKICLTLYEKCFNYAFQKGIIIADTKFEFGIDKNGNLVLADEIFTPDSSRFWSLSEYKTGISPRSYDKQYLRDWLLNNKVNNVMQFDKIPNDIIEKTEEIYQECMAKIIG